MHAPAQGSRLSIIGFGPAGVWPTWWTDFAARIPADWHFVSAVLPGRARRVAEPALSSVAQQVADVAGWIEDELEQSSEIHLLGFCSGALLAYETAVFLSDRGTSTHLHLVNPPAPKGASSTQTTITNLSPADFERALIAQGLIPKGLAQSREAMDLFAPALWADIAAVERSVGVPEHALQGELLVYHTRDNPDAAEIWCEQTGITPDRVVALLADGRDLIDHPGQVLAVPLALEVSHLLDVDA